MKHVALRILFVAVLLTVCAPSVWAALQLANSEPRLGSKVLRRLVVRFGGVPVLSGVYDVLHV
jgi:hypothetical protein